MREVSVNAYYCSKVTGFFTWDFEIIVPLSVIKPATYQAVYLPKNLLLFRQEIFYEERRMRKRYRQIAHRIFPIPLF